MFWRPAWPPTRSSRRQRRRWDGYAGEQVSSDEGVFALGFDRLYQLGDPPNYEPTADTSVAARAAQQGRSAADLAYDLMLEREGRELLHVPFNNWTDGNLDVVREMITHPYSVPRLGDAGAHCGLLSDCSFPTFLLTHWGRDRPTGRLPIEWLVKRQTKDTAELVGLLDRGVLLPGFKADINVVDCDSLHVSPPELTFDLPANGRRLPQRATGTGRLPGKLIRGAQGAPVSAN
jgi:N-acyl-D-aspartate/D-glutamate deacylase